MIPPNQAKLRAAALRAMGHAVTRIYDYAMLDAMHNRIGRALWSVERAEKRLAAAKSALKAWQKAR